MCVEVWVADFGPFWALLVKVGAWFAWELKVVAGKVKDNINVCVEVCFVCFWRFFGGKLNGVREGSGIFGPFGYLL